MDKTLQCTSVAMCDASCTLFFGFVYWHSHPCDKVRYLPTHGWCFSLKTTDSRNNLNWLWRSESIMKWCDLIINNSHEIINPPGSKQQMPQCSTPSSSSPIPPPWDYCGSYSADEIKMQGMFGIMCLKTSWYEASTYSMRQSPILQLQDLKIEIIVWITIYLAVNFFINKMQILTNYAVLHLWGICPIVKIQMYIPIIQ